MKYQRLKSIDGSGTIMRYYKFTGDEAYANAFYGVTDGVAEKIEGTVGDGVQIIGFSHGGNNLAKGLLFLDINPAIVYMAILGDGDDRPDIGDVVNGYQKVIDTHYDGDDGVYGKNDELFGVERLDAPYYIFTIVQPEGTEYASEIDDDDAGEISGKDPNEKVTPEPVVVEYTYTVKNSTGYSVSLTATPEEGDAEEETLADGATYTLAQKIPAGQTLSTVYTSVEGDCEGDLTWAAEGSTVINSNVIGEIAAIHTVTFDTDGGSSVADQLVFDGGKATAPADPTKDTKTFGGWYKDAELTTAFDFATDTITDDTTLYAKWERVTPTTVVLPSEIPFGSYGYIGNVPVTGNVITPTDAGFLALNSIIAGETTGDATIVQGENSWDCTYEVEFLDEGGEAIYTITFTCEDETMTIYKELSGGIITSYGYFYTYSDEVFEGVVCEESEIQASMLLANPAINSEPLVGLSDQEPTYIFQKDVPQLVENCICGLTTDGDTTTLTFSNDDNELVIVQTTTGGVTTIDSITVTKGFTDLIIN